jgi:hypothetical protein
MHNNRQSQEYNHTQKWEYAKRTRPTRRPRVQQEKQSIITANRYDALLNIEDPEPTIAAYCQAYEEGKKKEKETQFEESKTQDFNYWR